MNNFKCSECGGDIVCKYKKADLYFYIDDFGFVRRDENNDLWMSDGLKFQCSNDSEHEITPERGTKEFNKFEAWKDEFTDNIMKYMREEL